MPRALGTVTTGSAGPRAALNAIQLSSTRLHKLDNKSGRKGGLVDKKFAVAWIILFIVWMVGSFLVHATWLGDTYAAMTDVYRTAEEQEKLFPFMLLAHVMLAGGFVWIYRRGREAKPWIGQGIRFGILIALFAVVPTYLIYFSVQSMSSDLMIRQIIGDGLLTVVLGIVVAYIYKDAATA